MIRSKISDPKSSETWCIKGSDGSTLGKGSSVPLMEHDPGDLGSLIMIKITLKEHTL